MSAPERLDALATAVEEAVEAESWPWVVGVLEGAIQFHWSAKQTATFLREHVQSRTTAVGAPYARTHVRTRDDGDPARP